MSKMITIKSGDVPDIPDTIRCPICGARLMLEIDEWISDGDVWKAAETGVHTRCASEPDVVEDNYDAWFDGHDRYPYIDWLPVEIKVFKWLEDNYRFMLGA